MFSANLYGGPNLNYCFDVIGQNCLGRDNKVLRLKRDKNNPYYNISLLHTIYRYITIYNYNIIAVL